LQDRRGFIIIETGGQPAVYIFVIKPGVSYGYYCTPAVFCYCRYSGAAIAVKSGLAAPVKAYAAGILHKGFFRCFKNRVVADHNRAVFKMRVVYHVVLHIVVKMQAKIPGKQVKMVQLYVRAVVCH
jgi:hypothetical protein